MDRHTAAVLPLFSSSLPSLMRAKAQPSEGSEGKRDIGPAFLPARITYFWFFVSFCSVFPCLQSHQILPSQQPYCLCILHAYYQETLQGREVICSTGLFTLNVSMYLRCKCQGSCASKKKKSSQGCVYMLYFFFPFHNEQHYCFQLRRTKRKYLLLKTFFKNELMEKPVVLIQMNYTIIR